MDRTISVDVTSSPCPIVDSTNATIETMEQVPHLSKMRDGEHDSSTNGLQIEEPYVGMKFGYENEAYEYYKEYALAKGFGTRKGTTHNKDGQRIDRELNCNKEGFRREKDRVECNEVI